MPVHPRRPTSSYNSFIKRRVAELKAENTKLLPTEIIKQAAADFKALSADEKAKLDAEYQKRAAQFEAQKRDYEASQPPKKPMTSYIVNAHTYMQTRHATHAMPTWCAGRSKDVPFVFTAR